MYFQFGGFWWRIIRINGDGTNSTILGDDNSNDTTTLNGWYNTYLKNYEVYIDISVGFCSDRNIARNNSWYDNSFYYAAYDRRSSNANLQCNSEDILSKANEKLSNPIGLVTSDEVVLAGLPWYEYGSNQNNYLYTGQVYWTMSPYWFTGTVARVLPVHSSGALGILNSWNVDYSNGVRPVINLRNDVQITGSGTTSDPFKVVGAN